MDLYGAVEAGGTKFVCAVATGYDKILSEISFSTETPEKTLAKVVNYFMDYQQRSGTKLSAIGVGCFGPVDLQKTSETYGYITTTPKQGWRNVDITGFLEKQLNLPIGFDTDVNAAAFGEYLWGAGRELDVILYLTVGTGIGGGLYVHGKPLHGLMHPEMGHVLIQQDKAIDPFAGCCPYHSGCLEGLASGRAVDLRWGAHASQLPDNHQAWELEADYLSQGLMNYILVVSPQKIIIGGGLMHKTVLYTLIRKKVIEKLNSYIPVPMIQKNIDNYIVSPGLGTKSGIYGAIGLAMSVPGLTSAKAQLANE